MKKGMCAVENKSETMVEEARLKKTLEIAKEQLEQAKAAAEGKSSEIMEAKRYVREEGTHSLTNLYSADGFEALVELSQCMNPVTESIADYEEEQRRIFRLEKLMKKPYFARIDFCFDGEDEAEQIYIGRSSLTKKSSREIYVYDWRSPIASVFYRFMTGRAYYDAPGGTIGGEVELKRQYEITGGALEYFFDTDRNISDEFLRQMLSKNTSPQMKAIVETIQREQDVAIRDMENDLLMVQGVAGSGKTSIALHRAAYLMYQGLQSKLSANNILIISPNTAFEQYISNVLPELGEENVNSIVFEDILDSVLKGRKVQSKNEFLEQVVTNGEWKYIVKSNMEFKMSEKFRELLDQFIAKHEIQKIPQQNLVEVYKTEFGGRNDTVLWYEDAVAVTYLYLKIYGSREYQDIRQVVIDEAQDYYPLQYEIFRILFPNAKFTVLGDINQTLAKREDITFYEQVQRILNRKKASLVTLDKSFRCTNEILEFGLQFMERRPEIRSFNRNGECPKLRAFPTREELADAIVEEVEACKGRGYQTICLLCKTETNVMQLYGKLKSVMDLQLMGDRTVDSMRGTFIMPVYLSKGLEFDAVIICDVNDSDYNDEDDKKLLYVECTRALHRLSLFCEGEVSALIAEKE